jgi:hypothetical protein
VRVADRFRDIVHYRFVHRYPTEEITLDMQFSLWVACMRLSNYPTSFCRILQYGQIPLVSQIVSFACGQ